MRALRGRNPLVSALLVSALVCLGVLGLRQERGLEALELAAYDWYLNHQPFSAAVPSPIVLITVTEEDLRRQGRWPLPDGTVAQALGFLVQQQPRVIGLDMFRDLPVPPGTQELTNVLKRSANIIVVVQAGGNTQSRVPAPPALVGIERVGFADVPIDRDGVVRRGLLYLDEEEQTLSSFALQVALEYFRSEGISPQPGYTNPQHLRLGEVTIPPFEQNDGGYIAADAQGYQFLLDFQGAAKLFPTFSLTTLLAGEVPSEALRDHIVLLGITADSVKDFFAIPYRSLSFAGQRVPGVVLQAYMVDQLLRVARQGTPPLIPMKESYEWGWVVVWTLLGGLVAIRVVSPVWFLVLVGGGIVLLVAVGYGAFLYRWWVPIAAVLVGWCASAILVRILCALWQTEEV